MSSQTCEAKRIQQNSAQQVVDQATQAFTQARQEYLACQGPAAQGAAALADAQSAMEGAVREAEQLVYVDALILGQLDRQERNDTTVSSAEAVIREEATKLRTTIDDLKTEIRTQRRRFLDSSPQSPATTGGLYFIGESDNEVLLAFVVCYVAFLVVVGLLLWMNHVPVDYFKRMTAGERMRLVLLFWGAGLGLGYVGLYVFT